jgi:glucose/arabinose dehydrogenase
MAACASVCMMSFTAPAFGQTGPFQGYVESVVATGLYSPTALAMAPDGRLFVAEQRGRLRVIDGELQPAPFVTLTVDTTGERGLVGVALDPEFTSNGFVYLFHTATTPTIHSRISRFRADGNVAVPGSETTILDLPVVDDSADIGGAINFGPDGKLYVAVGSVDATRSSTLENPFGKVLRINADGSIPSDNPFYAAAEGVNRAIWALGFAGIGDFSFQPLTGTMLINDNGSDYGEVNEGRPGRFYGEPFEEGPGGKFERPLEAFPMCVYAEIQPL